MWSCARAHAVRSRSYGNSGRLVQRLACVIGAVLFSVFGAVLPSAGPGMAAERPVKIVVLGDSLSAGYKLAANEAFPAQLEAALRAKGEAVEIANAGVSGDTASAGLARVDWSVPDGTDAVIVELGANDMLRAIDPKVTRAAIEGVVRRLKERYIDVLLCGMLAAPNLGEDYARPFNAIYTDIAAASGVLFYPFFLDGLVGESKLNQADGMHPTAAGVAVIVARITPKVDELIAQVRARNP